MTELEEKLKVLGVLDKFEANLKKSSKTVQEICGVASMPEGQSYTDFIKMLCEINPKDAMGGAFRWDETPEGYIFWRIVSELVTYDIEMLSPELLRFTYTKYMALNKADMEKFKEKLAELGVLDKFEANLEKSNEVHGFDADFITKTMSREANNPSRLLSVFKWNDTPEGFQFWIDVYLKLHD